MLAREWGPSPDGLGVAHFALDVSAWLLAYVEDDLYLHLRLLRGQALARRLACQLRRSQVKAVSDVSTTALGVAAEQQSPVFEDNGLGASVPLLRRTAMFVVVAIGFAPFTG